MNENLLWYKEAVIYELHVRSFCDGNGDGIGDFLGLTTKLDYLQELGVTAIWLLPFYPSPLRDDGYDIADYFSVNPSYGTLDDFKHFLSEAHKRGLRVITELVINHSSDQNPWFQRARLAAPGSVERDYYVWSETPELYADARIIFKDFESSNWAWDPVAKAYYWHRFFSHQPDLNFDSPHVHEAIFKMLDFWLEMGVDGLRLDAVPYLYEREGTSCENLPETHEYLRKLRKHIDDKFPGRMLLAEANQWPEDAAAYFGKGDECHMEFHFPLMPRLFMSLQMEDRFPIIDILDQTPAIPDNCQWAIFLRNHDELTLEMVTDEERDYMVRIYAQDARARINLGIRRRLAPLLGNNRRKIELIHALLLSLPGTPILYYGDEIGMGDNFYLGDRNGVRTPMQWSADRNAGFSRANPQQLFLPVIIDPEFHYEFVNVDMQQKNLSSLHWWIRRVLSIRKRVSAFADGTVTFLQPENSKVLAYLRENASERILVVANLSRFSQAVRIDLAKFAGVVPSELFGETSFPEISEAPYAFTIGPHGFYWLRLPLPEVASLPSGDGMAHWELPAEWSDALMSRLTGGILQKYLRTCRWFGGKQQAIRSLRITANIVEPVTGARILRLEITFAEGNPTRYFLPLAIASASAVDPESARAVVASFPTGELLVDALYLGSFRAELFRLISTGYSLAEPEWRISGRPSEALKDHAEPSASRLLGGEQSNTSIAYGTDWTLKFIRHFEAGIHPEADVLCALGKQQFPHVPNYGGEIHCADGESGSMALLTRFVPNQGNCWDFTLDALGRYFERVLAVQSESETPDDLIGGNYPERIRQLGIRTGELHCSLARIPDSNFIPEPFTGLYQRGLYQSLRSLARRTEFELSGKLSQFPEAVQIEAEAWLEISGELLNAYQQLLNRRIQGAKTRVHGDYHLGQVLNTGKDFVIIDFEGEPRRSIGERLLKRSPLVDVAGMLRSLDYAIQISLASQSPEDQKRLEPWINPWLQKASQSFLDGYLLATAKTDFLPDTPEDFRMLLRIFLLDKAVYEIGYELSYRPECLFIPVRAVRSLLEDQAPLPDIHF